MKGIPTILLVIIFAAGATLLYFSNTYTDDALSISNKNKARGMYTPDVEDTHVPESARDRNNLQSSPPLLTLTPELNNKEVINDYHSGLLPVLSCKPKCISIEYKLITQKEGEEQTLEWYSKDSYKVDRIFCTDAPRCYNTLRVCGTNEAGTTCEEWRFTVNRLYYFEFNNIHFDKNPNVVKEIDRTVDRVGVYYIEGIDTSGTWVSLRMDKNIAKLAQRFPKGVVENRKLYVSRSDGILVYTWDGGGVKYTVPADNILSVEENLILFTNSTGTYICDTGFNTCLKLLDVPSISGDIAVQVYEDVILGYFRKPVFVTVLVYDGQQSYVYYFTPSLEIRWKVSFKPPGTPLFIADFSPHLTPQNEYDPRIIGGDGFLVFLKRNYNENTDNDATILIIKRKDIVYTDGITTFVHYGKRHEFLLTASERTDSDLTPAFIDRLIISYDHPSERILFDIHTYEVPAISIVPAGWPYFPFFYYFVTQKGYGTITRDGISCLDETPTTERVENIAFIDALPAPSPVSVEPPVGEVSVEEVPALEVTRERVYGERIC